MIKAILQYFNLGSRFYGLEICHIGDSTYFFLLKVRQKKDELIIENEWQFENIQDTINAMESSFPIFLSFNTKGVLTKVANQSNQAGRALAHSLFPNMDEESLYFESYVIKNQSSISIVRKDEINSYLDAFKKAKLSIYSMALGLSSLEKTVPYIQEEEIFTHSQVLSVSDDGNLNLSQRKEILSKEYVVNGLEVSNTYILSLGAILRGIFGTQKENTNLFESITQEKTEYRLQRNFKLILNSAISLLLSILLVNFVFFSHYHQKVADLREESSVNENSILRLKQLKEQVASKESRLEKAWATSNSQVSHYLDEIAEKIPHSILLEEITYQPLDKPISPNKSIEYQTRLIMVLGMASDNLDFTDWIRTLEDLEWTQSVETLEYDFQSATTSMFHLKIKIQDADKE